MRNYLRLFFSLLMPISVVMTIVSVAYFSVNYDFTKSMKLGVLSGVLLGLGITVFAALYLLVTRGMKKPVQKDVNVPQKTSTVEKTNIPRKTDGHKQTNTQSKDIPLKMKNSVEQKLMLLMDKKIAFEVALYAIKDQDIGEIETQETKESSTIMIHAKEENILITIISLTRHTSQIILQTERNSKYAHNIISYIKEKEHSFLQY